MKEMLLSILNKLLLNCCVSSSELIISVLERFSTPDISYKLIKDDINGITEITVLSKDNKEKCVLTFNLIDACIKSINVK